MKSRLMIEMGCVGVGDECCVQKNLIESEQRVFQLDQPEVFARLNIREEIEIKIALEIKEKLAFDLKRTPLKLKIR